MCNDILYKIHIQVYWQFVYDNQCKNSNFTTGNIISFFSTIYTQVVLIKKKKNGFGDFYSF